MDALRTYLGQYPGLRGGVLHMDCLPLEARTYSLSVLPCNPLLRTYMDGGQRRQTRCLLESRRFFGESLADQQENLRFFGEFDAWLRRKNQQGDLPELGETRVCLKLCMISCGYAMDADQAGYGRYQAEILMEYFEAPITI